MNTDKLKTIITFLIIIICILVIILISQHQEIKFQKNRFDNLHIYQLYFKDTNQLDENHYFRYYGKLDTRAIGYSDLKNIYSYNDYKELKNVNDYFIEKE